MAMMEISVIPLGTGKTSVSPYIAAIFKYLRKQKGIRFELNGMGTIVTGKADQLLKLAATLHKIPFTKGAKRVYTVIKLDERKDKKQFPVDKVDSVLKKL
ncbi:MAG TPA: MTH1187 family thiamine-binding protein [bacterium]